MSDLPEQQLTDTEASVLPIKKETLTENQVLLWVNRAKTANKHHRNQFIEKYKVAKKSYNSESFGFQKTKDKYTHETFNFLYKDIEDFNGSVYYKNPQIDLTCRDTQDTNKIRNIENLEQVVNDEIKDDRNLKALIRASLVDEALSGIGAVYLDYDYRVQGETAPLQQVANKVRPCKIMPENLIPPPNQTLYNYQDSPYLGFWDIVSLECLKNDPTLDQTVISGIKGKSYLELLDVDKEIAKKDKTESDDNMLYAKVAYLWLKGDDNLPLKRLVILEDTTIKQPLAYEDWDRGNGPDERGYPIHILALNDPCEGLVPPSEAWLLRSILDVINYLMTKMLKHLKRSKTRTLVKGGKDGMTKESTSKWLGAEDMEFISLNNLPPGLDIRSLIHQIEDQPLSADHSAMFDLCKRVFDELSRKPALAQVSVQEKQKTATETEAIQRQDMSQSAYKVDKFKDFLMGFFYDWAKLTQKNMRGTKEITVKNKNTGIEEPRSLVMDGQRNDLDGDFSVDINIESFTMPNKEVKRRQFKETMMDLFSLESQLKQVGKKVNPERVVSEQMQNIDARDPDGFLMDIPTRTIDQQVLDLVKGVPMSIEDLAGDYEGSLQRLMEIFADDELMARLETFVPGIGGSAPQMGGEGEMQEGGMMESVQAPESPLALMARDLEALIKQKQGQPQGSQASTDVGIGAAQMAGVQ